MKRILLTFAAATAALKSYAADPSCIRNRELVLKAAEDYECPDEAAEARAMTCESDIVKQTKRLYELVKACHQKPKRGSGGGSARFPSNAPEREPEAGGVGHCPERFTLHKSEDPLTCECSTDAVRMGTVWGIGVYTADSSICRAAVHAGVITAAGGTVTIDSRPGRTSYEGRTRNGVTSKAYGKWPRSFAFAAQRASAGDECPLSFNRFRGSSAPVNCSCSANATGRGTVWGTGVYTDDSSICKAALHAGVIPASGGAVTAYAAPGRSNYSGSARNGVVSRDFGSFRGSLTFTQP